MKGNPISVFALAALVLAAATAVPLMLYLRWSWLLALLTGINAATFLLYGYDKAIAGGTRLRVPEAVLQGLAFLGGSPAALLGQQVFRHKTSKVSFQRRFWLILLLQALLIGAWVWCAVSRPAWMPPALRFLFPK